MPAIARRVYPPVTMCGRYALSIESQEELAALIDAFDRYPVGFDEEVGLPRFNIAPTQRAPVLIGGAEGSALTVMRWGLIPFWAKDPSIGNRLINARSETIAEKPSFRGAWRARRRCMIPATGFYEWRKPEGGKGAKVPYFITCADGRPFGFAGIWEEWGGGEAPVRSFTILTTGANDLVRPLHDRMPVILGDPAAWERWIDPAIAGEDVADLMAPFPADEMHLYPVSTRVNNPRNEGAELLEATGDLPTR